MILDIRPDHQPRPDHFVDVWTPQLLCRTPGTLSSKTVGMLAIISTPSCTVCVPRFVAFSTSADKRVSRYYHLWNAGVELVLYFFTMKLVADTTTNRTNNWVIPFLSTARLLCMITIYLFAQNFFGQEM